MAKALREVGAEEKNMTMPHLMNCAHQEEGWCLSCVREQWSEMNHYRGLLESISQDSRRTRARRLAESGLIFWDTMMEEKRKQCEGPDYPDGPWAEGWSDRCGVSE